ncbi:PTPA-CTERM sorting domain-containing protein [Leptolyngbya sp. GB1-A1]|uniref:PTPA-CTERM sorting domain-containing protein n=1 Tax=Leptolyngbya sp. GB1-A1 TaxID=2933908 RepID=UPI003297123A
MNFSLKALAIGIGAAAAVGIALDVKPAQAVNLTGTLNFFGNGDEVGTDIDFRPFFTLTPETPTLGVPGEALISASTGSFAAVSFQFASILDIPQNFVGSQLLLDFVNNDFDFTVTSLTQVSTGLYSFAGVFGTGTPGIGQISTQTGTTFSGGIQAVPTPALVPAALGFGAAMLRKRKGEKAEKEAAGVKA